MKKKQANAEQTIHSIVLDGVEYRADGVKTVLAHPLPDEVEYLRVGDTVVTNANKASSIKYIVLNGQKLE